MLLITIYKDKFHIRDDILLEEVPKSIRLVKRSLQHNIEETRKILDKWACKQIEASSIKDWKKNATKVNVSSEFINAYLNADLTDFSIGGRTSINTGDESWSYKNNGPAHRYLLYTYN